MKLLKIILIFIFLFSFFSGKSQIYLTEGFETGARPEGWTEETVSGNEPWRYRNGGHSPNDNNWLVPPEQEDITRNPPSAYEGTFNAIFFKQGNNNERTKLITPELDLLGGTNVELSFYLCQIPWTFEGSTGWDVLRIYYKISQSDPWVPLHEYLDPVYEWELQTLVLPNLSSTYYIAFEGHTRWGYGTCIDNIVIEEKGSQPLWIGDLQFKQPFSDFVPSGSNDVPIMRIDFKVFGNTGTAILDHINFTSLNTSDSDILSNGVKLYSTLSQAFSTDNPLGTPTNFNSGIASFTGLNHNLQRGHSYLWLTYDVDLNATHGNILDVMVATNGILANDTLYPSIDQSPEGDRMIYETRYFQDFEGSHNWTLTGEFEVGTPNGMGGSPGNPNPSEAFRGTRVLGTDLTGLGANPYNYEPGLSELTSYRATSPTIDVFYYKNLNLFFQRYMNIEVWDNSSIQVSTNDGTTWNTIWESTSYLSDFQWVQEQIPIPNEYSRTQHLKIRYKLGSTDGQYQYSGWNIDDIYITGEFISKDVGVSEWIYPLSGSGHSATDSVTVRIENYGGATITDPVPVAYSFDGGSLWVVDIMTQNIPIGGSVIFTFPTKVDLSSPGFRPSVLAKTMLPGDQYTDNDQISTEIYIVPTYSPPYMEDFELNDGYWRDLGNDIWEYGTPAATVIDTAASGTNSWVTGLTQTYEDLIAQKNQIIFEDDFETDFGWIFTGEFERNIPSNMYLPYFAYSGLYCIGTDLSGQGASPYNYENGISTGTAYTATSPAFDVTNYSNLHISYVSWTTIQAGDSVKVEVSRNNGTSWTTLWKNTEGEIMDVDYQFHQIPVHDSLSYTSALRFRFSLYHSSASGPVAEGWNIDDFILFGDLVNSEPGYLISPSFDLTGLIHPVFNTKLWLDTEQDVDGATLYYSLDDGNTWTPISNTSGYDTYWNWYTGKPVSALGTNGWSGQSSGWITARHLLPAALINQDNVQFRFKFMADKVNNQYDGIGVDDVRIIEAPHDIGVFNILDPMTACELSPNEVFTLSLRNYGITNLQPGDSIRIGYFIDRSGEIQAAEETIYLTQSFAPGTTRDVTLETEFDFSVSGEYLVDVYTVEEDPYFYQETANDTVSQIIRVNKPTVELGPDISTVRPDTVVLNAYSGVNGYDYLWQDNSTDSVFHVSTQGIYYVRVTNDLGCTASDTVEVMQLIVDVGVRELVSPLPACELGNQIPINITIQNFGTDTVDVLDTIFVFGEINHFIFFSDTLNLTENFYPGDVLDFTYSEEFDFSLPGTYQLKLYTQLRDDFTNHNDTLNYALEVYGYPDIDLGPDMVVMATEYLLEPTPGYSGYMWQDGSVEETFTVDQPGQGLYHVTVSNVHNCITTDSVYVTLDVTDVSLEQILSPETSCGLSETITVSARIKNTGSLTITSGETINLVYLIDGGSHVQDAILLDENFLPDSTIDFVFSQTETVVTGQWYEFTVYTNYVDDMKSWNDTVIMPVGVFETPVVDLGEDYQVITAVEHVLDAGPGFVFYEWQDGSTDQTFLVTEPGIGVYGVTVTDNNGCPAYDEVEIMLAVPDIGILEVVHPITTCTLGASENIRVAIKNFGNWDIDASSNITVAYSLDGAPAVTENVVLDATFENGAVIYHTFATMEDFSIPGHYQITTNTVYGSDLIPSNDTVLVDVDVYGAPVVDIGNGQDTILVYDPITLFAPGGYASYEWQDGNTNPSYQITVPSGGLYTVLVTDDNGCSTRDSVYVAYDLPDIGITQVVSPVSSCALAQNQPVSIEIVNNGYYRISTDSIISISYSVDGGGQVTEDITLSSTLRPGNTTVLSFSGGYDFSTLDMYQLDAELVYGPDEDLSNNQISSTVYVWGYPDVEIGGGQDTIITDLPITLDAGAGHTSYLWQDNSVGSTIEVTQYGLYWVMVTNEYGCTDRDSVYVDSETAVNNMLIQPEQIRIFPNPVQEILYVVLEMEMERDIILEFYSILNTLVYREDLKLTSLVETTLDVHGLAPGTYILRITADKVPHTYLVVVQ